jgi:hypothetical protein
MSPGRTREERERGFNSWLRHEEPRPARNWGILGLGDDGANMNAEQMADRLDVLLQERRQKGRRMIRCCTFDAGAQALLG